MVKTKDKLELEVGMSSIAEPSGRAQKGPGPPGSRAMLMGLPEDTDPMVQRMLLTSSFLKKSWAPASCSWVETDYGFF